MKSLSETGTPARVRWLLRPRDDVGKTGRHRNINDGVDLHLESGLFFGGEASTLSFCEIPGPSITYARIMPWHELTSRGRGKFLQIALVNDGFNSRWKFSSDIKRTYSSPVSNHSSGLPNCRRIASRTSAPTSFRRQCLLSPMLRHRASAVSVRTEKNSRGLESITDLLERIRISLLYLCRRHK